MARQHVEFAHAPSLPRRSAIAEGLPPGVSAAVLSEDSQTGAITFMADVKPQWTRREGGYYECPLELVVLAGAITIGKETLARGCYACLPAGVWHGPMASEAGAELLLMFDGKPVFTPSNADKAGARRNLAIRNLDLLKMPWADSKPYEGRPSDEIPEGLRVKYIRQDPDTTAYTLMCYQPPHWRDRKLEVHDTWEELLLLEGDYQMGLAGMVRGGTYIFRQGAIPHGPQATLTGSVWFGRGEKEINFDYQEVDWADGMIERYLASDGVARVGPAQPWGSWRG